MTDEIVDCVVVPQDRIAVLIGQHGKIKRQIEKETSIKLEIDSESGEVFVSRKVESDPLLGLRAIEIIKAIARGFAPQKAFKLINPNIYIEIIDISDFTGGKPKSLNRVRSRLIGTEGKVRKYIARLTSTDIVIYGKTIAIIGETENLEIAKNALIKIIRGIPHNAVFKTLERQVEALR